MVEREGDSAAKNAPARVPETYIYEESRTPSPRALYWLNRMLNEGWRPNSRVQTMGYSTASAYYGVTCWEYLHVLSPAERDGGLCWAGPESHGVKYGEPFHCDAYRRYVAMLPEKAKTPT